MSIDWITVGAQLVNFLLLVWLLKRFLYRPILDGIDAREQEIAARMNEAGSVREAAEQSRADFQSRTANLQHDREVLLAEARQAAEAEREMLLTEARERLAAETAMHEEQRADEAQQYIAELHRTGANALLALTRKALADLADESLEQRIVSRTVLHAADLAEQLKEVAGPDTEAVVTTHEALPQALRDQLAVQLAPQLHAVPIRFDTDRAQAYGLTLRVGGAQLGWTVDSYIDSLEALLHESVAVRKRGLTDAA